MRSCVNVIISRGFSDLIVSATNSNFFKNEKPSQQHVNWVLYGYSPHYLMATLVQH